VHGGAVTGGGQLPVGMARSTQAPDPIVRSRWPSRSLLAKSSVGSSPASACRQSARMEGALVTSTPTAGPAMTSSRRRRRASACWRGRGLHDARTRTSSPTRQPAPPPPHAAWTATTVRPGKAGEALAFGLAVKLGRPLACKLSSPVTRQHHVPLLGSAGTVMCPTVGSGPHRDITRRWSTRWKVPERCRPGW
jgi:hypothetical protein